MKKPVPRDGPAVIDATAGSTRLTTSSSDEFAGVVSAFVSDAGVGSGVGSSIATGSSAATATWVDGAGRGCRGLAVGVSAAGVSRIRNIAMMPPVKSMAIERNSVWLEDDRCGSDSAATAEPT
jgi:hypothetical protein